MVKICPNNYPSDSEESFSKYFEKYPFNLSSFQKYAIEAIVTGQHVLVTAHTGSGKTLPAEFSIEHFVSKGKKVIYTSPIKALSNQKFYEFSQKFPSISFGILTGDIKTNPEADVLIMTTEILMNTLYAKDRKNMNQNGSLSMFDMDIENDLACVVFDEIHYINDADRGKVWEETIMLLPSHIQMVMLSATLDTPEKFALWCETRGKPTNETIKQVFLTTTYERVVPLTHYSYITCTQGLFKSLKDKQLEKEIMKKINTLHVIQDSTGDFKESNYQLIQKTLTTFRDKKHYVKRQHVLNSVSKYMVEKQMLPAICFVLSRKTLELCAKEVTTVLLEDDSKVPYIIKRECEQIIRKLPNYQEYLNLPEYVSMVSLLEKGIAIHHAGIMPILREMVELLFAKGYIKLLFATETFAVGINMPTKTVLFTDINKFDGDGMRPFLPHEYTQMAGRAGRRGIDKIGYVIHLNNLFKETDQYTFKKIMKGIPQTLVSKFKISYNLLLNLLEIGETDYTKYVKGSLMQRDIENSINGYDDMIKKHEIDLNNMKIIMENCKTQVNVVEEFILLNDTRMSSVNKKRKEIDRRIANIKDLNKTIDRDVSVVKNYVSKKNEITNLKDNIYNIQKTFETTIKVVLKMMEKYGCITPKDNIGCNDSGYILTSKGKIASHIREVNCIVFSELIETRFFNKLESKEIVGILSCLTNVSVHEESKAMIPKSSYFAVEEGIKKIYDMYQKQYDNELLNDIDMGFDYSIHYDLIDYAIRWCDCETDEECKFVIQELIKDKNIFLGEFVKSLLKINNISSEMEKIAETYGDIELLSLLKKIPHLTLKFVATNQSLYI